MELERVTQEAMPRVAGVASAKDGSSGLATGPLRTLADSQTANPDAETDRGAMLLRFRTGLGYGIVLYTAFFATDVFLVTFIAPGRLWVYALLRAFGLILAIVLWLRLTMGRPPSARLFRVWDIGIYSTVSSCITLMLLESGGLKSLYLSGIVTVVVCRGAAQPEKWQRGIVSIGIPVLAHLATLAIATPFSPMLQGQWQDPEALASFVLMTVFLVAAVFFIAFAGHGTWALRQQVYEARRLGRYRLIQRIGAGAMGQVWEASHSTMKRNVAIKILQGERGPNPSQAAARFEREVRATTELTHPNTVRIYDYGVTDDGLSYYAMELLVGDTLQQVVEREGPFAPARAIRIVNQAARSLAEAHAHGIVHRDVKPANIILCEVGGERDFVKVIDFGIASLRTHDGEHLTRTGMAIGTPAFMAPEVVAGDVADERADIYALGCVGYFLLTGKVPHSNGRPKASDGADPPAPSLMAATSAAMFPAGLDEIVLRCLARDPANRFQSMTSLLQALSLLAHQEREKRVDETS